MLRGLLFALAAFLLVFPLARHLIFLAVCRKSGDLARLRRLPGGLAASLARGWVTAVAADLLALPLYPLSHAGDGECGGPDAPVVLVHGLYHNNSAWIVMRRRLRRAGVTNVHTYQYHTFSGTFEAAEQGLARFLDRLSGGRDNAPVVLVGHSLGGLLCRAVAGDPRYRRRVIGLATLGSPHGGAALARLGPNRLARALVPDGPLVRRMAEIPEPDCPRLAIYTPVDDYVFPPARLRPGRPGWRETVCPPMGHVWMLFSPTVAATLADFLRPPVRRG